MTEKTKKNILMNYKGFDENLKCRDFQYAVGKEYETEKAVACESGFHACEFPFDVFNYYEPAKSRYCVVEQSGNISKDSDDSKVASTKIKIGAEIGLKGIIEAGVKFILEKVDFKNAAATNTGNRSAATNTGDGSAATNTGNRSAATNTGDSSAATNTGNRSAATNTGNRSAATNTGDGSAATNTGDSSAATNTGYRSAATNTGKNGFAIATGIESKAKGALGCYIAVAEWKWNGNEYELKGFKAHKVDGKTIKADTFYTLKNGKFVKAK